MKHLLMDPAFPDIVGAWTGELIDDKARVWTIQRDADGRLEESLDLAFFARLERAESAAEIADAIVLAAAEDEIAATRLW